MAKKSTKVVQQKSRTKMFSEGNKEDLEQDIMISDHSDSEKDDGLDLVGNYERKGPRVFQTSKNSHSNRKLLAEKVGLPVSLPLLGSSPSKQIQTEKKDIDRNGKDRHFSSNSKIKVEGQDDDPEEGKKEEDTKQQIQNKQVKNRSDQDKSASHSSPEGKKVQDDKTPSTGKPRIIDIGLEQNKMAEVAVKITSDPQAKIKLLSIFGPYTVQSSDNAFPIEIQQMAIITQMQILIDIIPGYHIRESDLQPNLQKGQKLSKPILALRNFERTILSYYRSYLGLIISIWKRKQNISTLSLTAFRALCKLLQSVAHFNYSEILLDNVVPALNHPVLRIRVLAKDAVQSLLVDVDSIADLHLQMAMTAVKKIGSIVQKRGASTKPEVLIPLISVDLDKLSMNTGQSVKQIVEKVNKKKRKKMDAEERALEKDLVRDLQEANAEADPEQKFLARKTFLNTICQAYFKVLTTASSCRPNYETLNVVFRGLPKIAHLINDALLADLTQALTALANPDSSPALTLESTFLCIRAAQEAAFIHQQSKLGTSQMTDPETLDFYLVENINLLGDADLKNIHDPFAKDAIEAVFSIIRRRSLPKSRLQEFSLALLSAAASVSSPSAALGLIMLAYQTGFFLDLEEENQSDIRTEQLFWCLYALQRHYHPHVAEITQGFCKSQKSKIISMDPLSYFKTHASDSGGFNPPPPMKRQKVVQTQSKNEQAIKKSTSSFLNDLRASADQMNFSSDNIWRDLIMHRKNICMTRAFEIWSVKRKV